MKISDILISALLKKGILYEAREVDVEFKIPKEANDQKETEPIIIHFKADQMSIRIEKEN